MESPTTNSKVAIHSLQQTESEIEGNSPFIGKTTIRWIPQPLIPIAADFFADALKRVAYNPLEEQNWFELMKWPKHRLAAPTTKRMLPRTNKIEAMREQLTSELPVEAAEHMTQTYRIKRSTNGA